MQSIEILASYQTVLRQIRTAEQTFLRQPGAVHLLAVSKKQSIGKMRALADCGQRDFGESYLQEALEKMPPLADLDLVWHFIGPIQSNKTRAIAEHFAWVHSVDRFKIAERLNLQRPTSLPRLNVCLQVNISHEPTKSGFLPDELLQVLPRLQDLSALHIRGLMVIPAPSEEFAVQRQQFAAARQLFETVQQRLPGLDTLSMGMSGDMQAAIAEQSTWVRIGTALFGERRQD